MKEHQMIRSALISSLFALALFSLMVAADAPVVTVGQSHGDPPFLIEDGWTPLLNGENLDGWELTDPGKPGRWAATRAVHWGGPDNPRRLLPTSETGGRIVNTVSRPEGEASNLATTRKFGDVELYLEFMVADESNSGVYLHGLYEIQIWDSYGRTAHITDLAGAMYSWEDPVDEYWQGGIAPRFRSERPAGQWQWFHIWFQAPQFDESGKKIANAKYLRVIHNGTVIHRNIERERPTRSALAIPEAPENPIMLQGDHGPIAFRNIYVRPLRPLPPMQRRMP
jgi:3-keto-disaccharide hydrolase